MNADIILDDTFPHGTPAGYVRGCHGRACPSPYPCRVVYVRYQGDFAFRKRLDAGMSAAEIGELEEREAREALERERHERHERQLERQRARRKEQRRRARPATTRPRAPRACKHPREEVLACHAQGLTDAEIGHRLGLTRRQVAEVRRGLKLPVNKAARARRISSSPHQEALKTRREEIARLHGEGYTDKQIAEHLHLEAVKVAVDRRRLGLPPNKTSHVDRVRALHAEGLDDVQIGERLDLHARYIGKIRREAGLPAIGEKKSIDNALRGMGHLSDRDAAEMLGVTVKHVQRRRRRISSLEMDVSQAEEAA